MRSVQHKNMPPRAISVLTILQWLVIFLGLLVTGFFLKLHGIEAIPYGGPSYPLFPQVLRTYGFWLLLIPFGWGAYATVTIGSLDAAPSVSRFHVLVGSILLCALFLLFMASAITACTAGFAQVPK
jgi:hypothetical protein